MLNFLSTYWIWILFIGGMLVMHRAHCGANAGGCGGGHASHEDTAEHAADSPGRGPVSQHKPPTA